MTEVKAVTLAMTGASGAPYGLRLLQCLVQASCRVHLLISDAARTVINTETNHQLPAELTAQEVFFKEYSKAGAAQLKVYHREDWFAPVASGSAPASAMVICPCSGGSLAAIASGASNNLIERAADVTLKERRKLILVPRETPYSEIHLRNMLELTRMGALVLPASPGFYLQPKTIEDLVDFVVARILDHLGLPQTLIRRWGEEDGL